MNDNLIRISIDQVFEVLDMLVMQLGCCCSSSYFFFNSISIFLWNWSKSIWSRSGLLQFEIELFQFFEAWRKGTESVPFGTRNFQFQPWSVLMMDVVVLEQLNQDRHETERQKPSTIANIMNQGQISLI